MINRDYTLSLLLASTFLTSPVLAEEITMDNLNQLTGAAIKWGEYEGGSASSAPSGYINLGTDENPNIVFYKYEKPNDYTSSNRVSAVSKNINNQVFQNQSFSDGGAIMNSGNNSNVTIKADFINNHATGNYGGAIHNANAGKLKEISGTFIKNEANYGGAISSRANKADIAARIDAINGDFIENTAQKYGGAIYNHVNKGNSSTITDITANFIANKAETGGAIYNGSNAQITNIKNSNFISNTGDGAIYNEGTIGTISDSSFLKNNGNAIENHGTLKEIVNSSFQENAGSAIYSENDIKVSATEGKISLFDGNDKAFNINKTNGTLTLNVEDGGIITINDTITGTTDGYNLDITSNNGAEVNLNGDIENAHISQNGNVSLTMDWKNISDKNNSLDLNDGNLTWEKVDGALKLNSFGINNGMLTISHLGSKGVIEAPVMNLKDGFLEITNADVDLANEEMGHLKAETMNLDPNMYIGIEKFTLLSDAEKEKTNITFLEATEKNGELDVDYPKDELTVTSATEAVAPVYKYAVNYDKTSGAFEFERFKLQTEEPDPDNPNPDNPNPDQPDNPGDDDNKPGHGIVDKEYKIYNEGAFANDVFSLSSLNTQEDVINQTIDLSSMQELDYSKGRFWATPYYNNSTLNYKNFYNVDSESYGVVAGLDSKAYDYDKIRAVYTVFGAYNNGEDKYQGIHVDNRSWVAGLKASIYRGGFYGDALVNYAMHDAELKTAHGHDNVDTDGYGAALRAGYIFDTARWVYDTSLMLNWQTVDGNDYTSASGAKVSTDDYSRLSLTPQLKIGYKAATELTPYALVRYHATLSEDGNSIVNDIALSEIENKDSVEYGFGFETNQNAKHNAYVHILRQDGGVEGWRISAGYKYNF